MPHRISELRIAAIAILGGCCARCGITDIRGLQIDHVAGNGCKERAKGPALYKKVIQSVRDKKGEYQCLCATCNWIKRYNNSEHKHSDIQLGSGKSKPKKYTKGSDGNWVYE